ncbi:MAG: type II secretion system F family protein [archaeon]
MSLKETYHNYKELITIILSILAGSAIVIINILIIGPESDFLFTITNIIAVGTVSLPIAIVYYNKYKLIKAYEDIYPDFLRTIVEGLSGGMSLPLAINYASQSNYGILTPAVKKLVAQISWGVCFEDALRNFADTIQSPVVTRSVSTIIECHRSGGNIGDVLNSVSGSLIEIEKIRRERSMMISSQMMTGYIIFFVFIVVMIGIREFFLCGFSFPASSVGGETFFQENQPEGYTSEKYGTMFTHLAIIQGFFAGLVIGKLSEGRLSAGTKHAIILALTGYTSLVLAHEIIKSMNLFAGSGTC